MLDRLAFGARPGDVARVRAMGVDQWIALQLAPDRIPDAATESLVASRSRRYHLPTRELAAAAMAGQQAIRQRARQLAQQGDTTQQARHARRGAARRSAAPRQLRALAARDRRAGVKLARAVASERQLEEVMTDFWENHFSVFAGKGQTRLFLPAYDRDVIRPRALGNFRDLLGAVAKSPAMLFYLDQFQSTVGLDAHAAWPAQGCVARACSARSRCGEPAG